MAKTFTIILAPKMGLAVKETVSCDGYTILDITDPGNSNKIYPEILFYDGGPPPGVPIVEVARYFITPTVIAGVLIGA